MAPAKTRTPRTFEDLSARIAQRHPSLSDRLRQIAEFAVQHPNEMALNTVSTLSQQIGVQPSAMVRFANSLGYEGFSEMQKIFRARLRSPSSPSYRERIALSAPRGGESDARDPVDILAEFVSDGISALETLYDAVPARRLGKAVELMASAATIYIIGQGRSFPVAYYLDYGLCRLDLKSHLLDGIGGLVHQRTRVIGRNDLLFVVSFKDYAPDTLRVATEVAERGVPIAVITDKPLGPYAGIATVSFEVGEARARAFQTLAGPMCLAQSLLVALGFRVAGNGRGT